MHISPDMIKIWQWGGITLNATILFTWVVMALIVFGSWIATRRMSRETQLSRWQNLLEVLVIGVRDQIREISGHDPDTYLPFVGTLFIFIAVSNLLSVVPGYHPPTGSLSTTAGLAICVFFAVPLYGIRQEGLRAYLRHYIQPSVFMLPFHIIGELSRTLSLAVRLFGNVMSDTMIAAILLSVAPLFFPVLMEALGLLTGLIQAYIFAVLAMLRSSVTRSREVIVYSTFEILQTARQRIQKVVREQIANDLNIRFERSSDLICGIELISDNYKVSWSIDNYLVNLEESFSTILYKGAVDG